MARGNHNSMAYSNRHSIDNYLYRNLKAGVGEILDDNIARYSLFFLIMIVVIAIIGPYITPYTATERHTGDGGSYLISQPPSVEHPLGTNHNAQDVLTRIIYGAQPTIITGFLGGLLIIGIGLTIGVTAGYVGGVVDEVLMRFTDFIYGVPMIPFAIVLLSLMGIGYLNSIFVIALIIWRGNARVLRSQVLQIRERPYIMAAKVTGASRFRIITKHIIPNIAPMAVLFLAIGAGYSIIIQAGLAFIGVTSPYVPSWGIMVRNAYRSGMMGIAVWWSIPPGLLISFTVLSLFLLGRRYEDIVGISETEGLVSDE